MDQPPKIRRPRDRPQGRCLLVVDVAYQPTLRPRPTLPRPHAHRLPNRTSHRSFPQEIGPSVPPQCLRLPFHSHCPQILLDRNGFTPKVLANPLFGPHGSIVVPFGSGRSLSSAIA